MHKVIALYIMGPLRGSYISFLSLTEQEKVGEEIGVN